MYLRSVSTTSIPLAAAPKRSLPPFSPQLHWFHTLWSIQKWWSRCLMIFMSKQKCWPRRLNRNYVLRFLFTCLHISRSSDAYGGLVLCIIYVTLKNTYRSDGRCFLLLIYAQCYPINKIPAPNTFFEEKRRRGYVHQKYVQ